MQRSLGREDSQGSDLPTIHPGGIDLPRTTLRSDAVFKGTALHSGVSSTARVCPAPPGHGIAFQRADIAGAEAIPARWNCTGRLDLCTCLVSPGPGYGVSTVEHLMAALAGLDVDDALVFVDGPELPILDGSAAPWLEGILSAGLVQAPGHRSSIEILHRVRVGDGRRWAALEPFAGFGLECTVDYSHRAIGRSTFRAELRPGTFRRELAAARTFALEADVEAMHARGLALGGSLDNAVVVGRDGVLNKEGLRFTDEFARHKALDAVGDLYLLGAPLRGRYVGFCAGHALNNALLRALAAAPSAWCWTDDPGQASRPLALAA